MSGKDQTPAARAGGEVTQSNADEVDAFLAKVRAAPAPLKAGERGRLIFAMDATMSRQPTWDTACRIQAEMFDETAKIGGLDVQLVYFRGFRECRASRWVADAMQLADLMTQVSCRGGHTQIGKVLKHVHAETEKAKVDAVVYVGDCMEESIDRLCHLAGELSILGVPVFMFQEGRNVIAERAFREIARLTGGAYCRFDAGSAGQLRQLLSAVAVYAAGGRKALADLSSARGGQAALLLEQLK
jgi:hypothetical protein